MSESKDPIERIETMVRGIHDQAEQYTQPVRKRYPLLFAFLFTFSVAAIFQGFEIFANQVAFFERHPFSLMGIGIVMLFLTGSLYKALQKND
jgi:hypothetical protein